MSGNWLSSMWTEEGSDSTSMVEDNATLSCAASNIGPIELPYPATLTIMRIIQSACYSIIILAALILNMTVIWLVAKFKKLQKTSLLILLQVVVLDLVLSLFLMSGLVTSITQHWLFGEIGCALSGFITSFISLARTLLLGVFVINRFFAAWPTFYRNNKTITLILCGASWVLPALFSLVMLPGLLDCYRFIPSAKVCLLSSACNDSCSSLVKIYGIIFLPVVIIPAILLAILHCKARKNKNSNGGLHKWNVTSSFLTLFILLAALVLMTTAIGVLVFTLTSTDKPPAGSYVTLVVNALLVTLFIAADPILFMLNKDVKKVISMIRKALDALNIECRNVQSVVPPDDINTTQSMASQDDMKTTEL
jgi:hypothetical protein